VDSASAVEQFFNRLATVFVKNEGGANPGKALKETDLLVLSGIADTS
jgi:hypothetical protein